MDRTRFDMQLRWGVAIVLCGCVPPVAAQDDTDRPSTAFTVVTMNTGTASAGGEGALTEELAQILADQYGHAMGWVPAEEAATAWFSAVDADIVAFQEIVWDGLCAEVTHDLALPLVCKTRDPQGPTQPQRVLGDGWQVQCHVGKPDKCVAVRRAFGTFRGCDDDLCLEGAWGGTIDGCGSGARVARSVIDRADGSALTLVSVHGSSGFAPDDIDCRLKQVERVFVDLGDGHPAASGDTNLILGDLNTDPGRAADVDASARRWLDFTGEGAPFRFVTDTSPEAAPTYAGIVSIDHVVSDRLHATAPCWHPGVTPGHPPVMDVDFFDHHPTVCAVSLE